MKRITAVVGKGKNRGLILKPHRYKDGHYVVGKGGNTTADSENVLRDEDLEGWVRSGYGIRMSAPGHAPSLFSADSLRIE
jgi:hypothetical protein